MLSQFSGKTFHPASEAQITRDETTHGDSDASWMFINNIIVNRNYQNDLLTINVNYWINKYLINYHSTGLIQKYKSYPPDLYHNYDRLGVIGSLVY